MDKNYDFLAFTWKCLYFKKVRVANFAAIKIATMVIKTTFEDFKKLRRIRNYVSKSDLYLCFLT